MKGMAVVCYEVDKTKIVTHLIVAVLCGVRVAFLYRFLSLLHFFLSLSFSLSYKFIQFISYSKHSTECALQSDNSELYRNAFYVNMYICALVAIVAHKRNLILSHIYILMSSFFTFSITFSFYFFLFLFLFLFHSLSISLTYSTVLLCPLYFSLS